MSVPTPGRASSGARRRSTTYADAGVSTTAGRRAVELIKESVRSTFRPEVVGDIGGFGGAFAFDPARFKEPLLVSGTDGAGTKILVAQMAGVHTSIGIDLVAMSVNDVVAHGAEPLFFLDYIVVDKVDPKHIEEIVSGIATGCQDAGCALIGGEIAEHPGHMLEGSYDLAGFCVGVVERSRLVTGARIAAGDVLLGIESSGLHSNGYSLVRKILLEDMQLELDHRPIELAGTLGEELLKPTTVYANVILGLIEQIDVHGIAHITGGGIPENVGRILPEGLEANIDVSSWQPPPIFGLIASLGRVERDEMFATFNMGIGMVLAVSPQDANRSLDVIRAMGHRAHEIGVIARGGRDEVNVVLR